MDFKIDANGVTPIPAPIHITTGYLKTSYTKKITTTTTWDKTTNKQNEGSPGAFVPPDPRKHMK